MKFIQLRYLTAIVEAGGYVAASRELNIAQPALSRQIKELEYEVGARLLDRGRHGASLTDVGQRFYNRARSILEQIEIARNEAQNRTSDPVGEVRVALPMTVTGLLAPKLVQRIENEYPGVSIGIVDGLGNQSGQVIETGQVDFGVMPNAEHLKYTDFTPILEEFLYLVTRRDGAEARPRTVTLRQVERMRLVMPGREFQLRRCVEEAVARAGRTLPVRYEHHSFTTILSFVRSGLAAAILNWPAVYELWQSGLVDARRIVKPNLSRSISLAVPANRPLTDAARVTYRAMRQLLIEEMETGNWKGRLIASE